MGLRGGRTSRTSQTPHPYHLHYILRCLSGKMPPLLPHGNTCGGQLISLNTSKSPSIETSGGEKSRVCSKVFGKKLKASRRNLKFGQKNWVKWTKCYYGELKKSVGHIQMLVIGKTAALGHLRSEKKKLFS